MLSFFWYHTIIESRSGANDNISFSDRFVIPSNIVIPPELLILSYELFTIDKNVNLYTLF